MAETKTGANSAPSTGPSGLFASAVDRTAEMSDDVLKSVESAQRGVIDAVRKFIDSVDKAMPLHGEGATRRQEIIDSAMDMVDRLVQTEHDFVRKIIDASAKSLGGGESKKSD